MNNRSIWVVALLLLILTTMAIASIVTYRSIPRDASQSTRRVEPGQTWGAGDRQDEETLPPNTRPQTPSGARDATQSEGNAPTGQGGPATSGRP